jgi:hypothetical protein
MSKYVKDDYAYGECPDCGTPIPHTAVEGTQCNECGFIFVATQAVDDDPILNDTSDSEAFASAGWGSDEDYGVFDSSDY